MRRETVDRVRKAVAENRRGYVLVNNRSEGTAPWLLTLDNIAGARLQQMIRPVFFGHNYDRMILPRQFHSMLDLAAVRGMKPIPAADRGYYQEVRLLSDIGLCATAA